MGLGSEAKAAARTCVSERIDRLARELAHMTPGTLACAIDELGRLARDNGMCEVADLARGLENAIAGSDGGVAVLPFLEAMSDASGHLASAGLARHG